MVNKLTDIFGINTRSDKNTTCFCQHPWILGYSSLRSAQHPRIFSIFLLVCPGIQGFWALYGSFD